MVDDDPRGFRRHLLRDLPRLLSALQSTPQEATAGGRSQIKGRKAQGGRRSTGRRTASTKAQGTSKFPAEDSISPQDADLVISFLWARLQYVRKNQPVPTPPPPPQGTPAPVFRPPPKPLPCACCKIHDLANPVARCATCSYSIHPACYGIEDESSVTPDWLCALCANVETEQYRRVPRCVLCPSTWKTKGPPPTVPQQTQLQALKPTLEGNWCVSPKHILMTEVEGGHD